MARIKPPPVYLIALVQLVVLVLTVVLLWLFVSSNAAYSAVIGGFIQILPQAWFTRRAYRYTSTRHIQNMVRAMYQAETGKIVFTAALFAIVFTRLKTVDPMVLFLTFGFMIIVQLFSASRLLKKRQ
jgi:ATP synthase protein I